MIAIGNLGGSHTFWGLRVCRACLKGAVFFGLACSVPHNETSQRGSASVLGVVGSTEIVGSMVTRLATARGIAVSEALQLLRSDALVAEHFLEDHPSQADALGRLTMAKQLLAQLRSESIALGAPSDDEVEQIAGARWWEMSRPRMVQVVHAVVLSDNGSEEARKLAEKLAKAVGSTSDEQKFSAAVKAVETGRLKVKVEALQPVAADGRTVHPDRPPPAGRKEGRLVVSFASAAHALEKAGDVSPVIHTRFGFHIMVMHKQWEAHRNSSEDLREHYGPEIFDIRTRRAQERLLDKLRRSVNPSVERAALTRMVQWKHDR